MFFKRSNKKISYRLREIYMVIFFAVSFFIYGAVSLYFYLHPSIDPLAQQTPASSTATLVLISIFFLWGVSGLVTKHSIAGRVFSGLIVAESSTAALWRILFSDASPQAVRLSGAIEGIICFSVLLTLMAAARKGASIWR